MNTKEDDAAANTVAALFLISAHPATKRRMRQMLRVVALSPEDSRKTGTEPIAQAANRAG